MKHKKTVFIVSSVEIHNIHDIALLFENRVFSKPASLIALIIFNPLFTLGIYASRIE